MYLTIGYSNEYDIFWDLNSGFVFKNVNENVENVKCELECEFGDLCFGRHCLNIPAPTPQPSTPTSRREIAPVSCGFNTIGYVFAILLSGIVTGFIGLIYGAIVYGTAVPAEEIGNNDNDFNRLFASRGVTIAPVALIFGLLNGIIGFNFGVFGVTTTITTHDNKSERERCDCECVFENENVAFATQISLRNDLIRCVCGTPHDVFFATIIFGFKKDVVGFNNGFNFDFTCVVLTAIMTHDNERENEYEKEGEVGYGVT